MNCIKKFSRIVCVSLFSYQGCSLSSLCDSLFTLSYLSRLVKNFFSKVFEFLKIISKVVCFCRSVQATWLLYHKFSRLSIVNLNFLKTILFFSISEAIPCDSLFTIPLSQGIVKHFLQKVSIFFVHHFWCLFCVPFLQIVHMVYFKTLFQKCFTTYYVDVNISPSLPCLL